MINFCSNCGQPLRAKILKELLTQLAKITVYVALLYSTVRLLISLPPSPPTITIALQLTYAEWALVAVGLGGLLVQGMQSLKHQFGPGVPEVITPESEARKQ
jgi:hypothetical protein